MARHLAYLHYILRHKWFVFWECVKLGIVWRGLIHDWHKFLPGEWGPYAEFFYSRDGTPIQRQTLTGDAAFDYAWLLHQKRGRHHWQWWVLLEDEGGVKILPMGEKDRLEMLADWRGMGRALGKPDIKGWYEANEHKIMLNPDTRQWIEEALGG